MNNKFKRIGIILFALILSIIGFNYSVKGDSLLPESSYEFYVYDEVNILDKATEEYIIGVNKELYEKTGVQIVVAAVDDLASMDINRYATKLYEKWKIGSKEYDNGLLILIVPEERQLWIEVGYGLEGALPDSRVKRIIDQSITPSFAEGDYNKGVISGFNNILDYVESEYNINLDSRNPSQINLYEDEERQSTNTPIVFIIGIIIFLFIDFKFFGGWLTLSLLRGSGRGGGGFGGGSSSGGSSGGGGRSGGGGAGGSW